MCFQLTPEYLLYSLKNTIKKQQTFVWLSMCVTYRSIWTKGSGVLEVNIWKYLYQGTTFTLLYLIDFIK